MMETEFKIYKTDELCKFKRLLGNRDITESRVSAIIDSIEKVGYQPVPILVNEKMEVIDGQGRLEACKRLGLPIYYIVKNGIGIDECMSMNIKMQNWTIYDFIKSRAEQGNESYVKLMEYSENYPDLTPIEIAMCLSGGRSLSKNVIAPLRAGTYKIDESLESLSCLEFINSVAPMLKKLNGGQNYYLPVLVGLFVFNLIDEIRMRESIEKYGSSMSGAYNADDALTELQSVYNLRKHHSIYFRDKYLEAMTKQGARYSTRGE